MTQKCENERSFSCLIAFHTLLCRFSLLHLGKQGTNGCPSLRRHGERGEAGPVLLLWAHWERGHGEAAGEIWTRRQLSAQRQRHCAWGLLPVCEVSCRRRGASWAESVSFILVMSHLHEFVRLFFKNVILSLSVHIQGSICICFVFHTKTRWWSRWCTMQPLRLWRSEQFPCSWPAGWCEVTEPLHDRAAETQYKLKRVTQIYNSAPGHFKVSCNFHYWCCIIENLLFSHWIFGLKAVV